MWWVCLFKTAQIFLSCQWSEYDTSEHWPNPTHILPGQAVQHEPFVSWGHSEFPITHQNSDSDNTTCKNTMLATNPALYIIQPESLLPTSRSSLQAKRSPVDQRWRHHRWAPPQAPLSARRSRRRRAFRRCYWHLHSSYFASPSFTARTSRSSSVGKRK